MKRAEPGWAVLALASIAALIGSFLPFYTFGSGIELTVWNRSLFPTATLIPVLLFGIGLEAVFVLVTGHEPRSPFLTFTWSQARLAGAAFASVLALAYLVQGRAGGSLGSGYVVMSLASVASYVGAVMTRRAELARGREEEITPAEHPWRAAFLRWRKDLAARVNAYSAGSAAKGAQRAAGTPSTAEATNADAPHSSAEDKASEATPVPRLSAVQSEPEIEEEPAPVPDEPAAAEDATAELERAAGSEPTTADLDTASGSEPGAAELDTAPDAEAPAEAAADSEPEAAPEPEPEAVPETVTAPESDAAPDIVAAPDGESSPDGEAVAEAERAAEAAAEDEATAGERQRPAAPG